MFTVLQRVEKRSLRQALMSSGSICVRSRRIGLA